MIQDDACRSQFMLCMFCIVENYFDFQEIFVYRGERVFLSLQETVILLCIYDFGSTLRKISQIVIA